jgi:L-threonylcarbamoyladenylate synthase
MRCLKIATEGERQAALKEAARCLRHGGVIAAPTETVYGLMTLWSNQSGRERIFQLKARSHEKHLQMLAADLAMAQQQGVVRDARLATLARHCWPGPLTVVANSRYGDTIGLRIPDHSFILALLRELGECLAATSANLSGEPAALNADDACANLTAEPDLLIDGGPVEAGVASSVVSLAESEMKVLRPGPYSREQLQSVLAQQEVSDCNKSRQELDDIGL